MTKGTLQFKEKQNFIGEKTLGNERRVYFSPNVQYDVQLDAEKLASKVFIDIQFAHVWVAGINPELFTFVPSTLA
jgi:hypothetical protein